MRISGQVEPAPDGRTPAGGVAYMAFFFDAQGEALPNDVGAAAVEIHELDGAGLSILRTYAQLAAE